MRHLFVALCAVLFLFASSGVLGWRQTLEEFDADVQERVRAMTLEQKVGQMGQMSLDSHGYTIRTRTLFSLNETSFNSSLDEDLFGSLFDSPVGGGYSYSTEKINFVPIDMWRDLITRMQQIALDRGSKQPIIYALDLVHGAHYLRGSTIFPQQINIAASFNRSLARAMGDVTARNARAAGVRWTFSPIADLALQPSWPRVFEQLGEDPYLSSQMIQELVWGLQGKPKNLRHPNKIAACVKHFIGYGNPVNGHDVGSTWIPDRYLYMYFLPAFEAAIKAGVETTMEDYIDINGEPVASSRRYLTDLLRDYLGFDGVLVTDWMEIRALWYGHHVASSAKDAVNLAFSRTSIDMDMVPVDNIFQKSMTELVSENTMPMQRIDAAAARIVQLKKDLGLFENPFPASKTDEAYTTFGSQADEDKSLQSARESLVLVKNDNSFLPLRSDNQKLLLVGPGCDSRTMQTGGWTIHWQGAYNDSEFWSGSTLRSAIAKQYQSVVVSYHPVFGFNPEPGHSSELVLDVDDLDAAVKDAAAVDTIVVCLGEFHYSEKPGDIDSLELAPQQQFVWRRLNDTRKPIVSVLIEGRPRVLNGTADNSTAVIVAMLPGPHGGQALAELLFGAFSPSGRLPISYPKHVSNALNPYWRTFVNDGNYRPQWKFGTGLSYTSFSYSNLRLSAPIMTEAHTITVSVDVTNTGSTPSAHSVLLFVQQTYRIVSPEVRLLKAFDKIFLSPHETKTVVLPLHTEQLSFWGVNTERRWQNGLIQLFVGAEDDEYALRDNFTLALANEFDVNKNAGINPNENDLPPRFKDGPDNTLSTGDIIGICIGGGAFILLGLCVSLVKDRVAKYPPVADNRTILISPNNSPNAGLGPLTPKQNSVP